MMKENAFTGKDYSMPNITVTILVRQFFDGVNWLHRTVTIDRWYDAKHGDYVFTIDGEIEHLRDNASLKGFIDSIFPNKMVKNSLKLKQ